MMEHINDWLVWGGIVLMLVYAVLMFCDRDDDEETDRTDRPDPWV